MSIIDIILTTFYSLTGFGTFLRGNFHRQVVIQRGAIDPNSATLAVHGALWDVRTKFESLFKDAKARTNALDLFPSLRDLPKGAEEFSRKLDAPTYKRLALNSVLWPVMIPINVTQAAAANVVANERREAEAKIESYRILAEAEDDPALKQAFLSCDDEMIQAALVEKAKRGTKLAEIDAAVSPLLDLTKPAPVPDTSTETALRAGKSSTDGYEVYVDDRKLQKQAYKNVQRVQSALSSTHDEGKRKTSYGATL